MHELDSRGSDRLVPRGRLAGVAIAASALLALAAIAHHPTLGAVRARADVLPQLVALSTVDEVVHGTIIVLIGVLLFGFTVFSQRRGLQHGTVLAGLIAFALGSVTMVGAALIDGFLIPALAARYVNGSSQSVEIALHILTTAGAAIQVLAVFAIAVTAVAVVSWSTGLVASRGVLRVAGLIGLASAVLSVAVTLTAGSLNPHSLGAIVALQSIWYVTIGILLTRGDL